MDLVGAKILVLFLLGLIKLVSGLLPLLFSQALISRKAKLFDKFVGVALCLGGGVLLATVFIHMLPETRESLDNAAGSGYLPADSHYAFAELFVCLGFLLIYFIEAFVHRFFNGGGHSHGLPPLDRGSSYKTRAPGEQVEMNGGNGVGVDNGGFVTELDGIGAVKGHSAK